MPSESLISDRYTDPMSPLPRRERKRRSEMERGVEWDLTAVQRGSEERDWDWGGGGGWEEEAVVQVVVVVSEEEEVLRGAVVVVVELKLMLWRSSVSSSSGAGI